MKLLIIKSSFLILLQIKVHFDIIYYFYVCICYWKIRDKISQYIYLGIYSDAFGKNSLKIFCYFLLKTFEHCNEV